MGSERQMRIQFLVDSQGMVRATRDAISTLDDTASTVDKVIAGMDAFRAKTEQNMAAAASAADKLGEALGPELSAKIEQGGGSIDGVVATLKKMGLTYEEVEQNADRLAQTVARFDGLDTPMVRLHGAAGQARQGLADVHSEADQSRSVLANLVGNTAQDLGQLGGVAGTTGVAIGQLAEYAADGNIALGSLAGVAGPMLGLAAAGQMVSMVMGQMAEEAKRAEEHRIWNAEQVKGYTDALKSAGSLLDEITKKFVDAGKVELEFWNVGGYHRTDVTEQITKAGLTVDTFSKLVAQGAPLISAWANQMRLAGADTGAVATAVLAAYQQHELLAKGQQAAAISAAFFAEDTSAATDALAAMYREASQLGRTMDEGASSTRGYGQGLEDYAAQAAASATATDDLSTSAGHAAESIGEMNDQIEHDIDLQIKATGGHYDMAEALYGAKQKLDEYNKAVEHGKLKGDELATTSINVAKEMYGVAEKSADAAKAAGDTHDKNQLMADSLAALRDDLAPNSPLRKYLDAYIADLLRIPSTIHTTVSTSEGGATERTRSTGQTFARSGAAGGKGSGGTAGFMGPGGGFNDTSGQAGIDAATQQVLAAQAAAAAEKQAADDAAQAQKDAAADIERVWELRHDMGEITDEQYLDHLQGTYRAAIASTGKYSKESETAWRAWHDLKLKIQKDADDARLKQQKEADAAELAQQKKQADDLAAVFQHSAERRAADDAADAADKAIADLSSVAAKKGATPQEIAQAAQAAATALYNRASANAIEAGLDKGTVGWAGAVRSALEADKANAPVLAPYIDRILEGIPDFSSDSGRASGGGNGFARGDSGSVTVTSRTSSSATATATGGGTVEVVIVDILPAAASAMARAARGLV